MPPAAKLSNEFPDDEGVTDVCWKVGAPKLLAFGDRAGAGLFPPVEKLEKELLVFPAVEAGVVVCGVDGAPKLLAIEGGC